MDPDPLKCADVAPYRDEIYAEQVKQLYALLPFGLIATFVNSLLVFFVLQNAIEKPYLIAWVAVLFIISFARMFLGVRFRTAKFNKDAAPVWGNRFIVGLTVSGLVWGALGLLPFTENVTLGHEVFIAFVLGGMAAGAAATFAIAKSGYLAYSIPALLPLGVRFLLVDDIFHYAMTAMLLLYGVLLWRIARRHYLLSTTSLLLRFENKDMIEQLTNAKEDVEKLYQELLVEVKAKTQAENELRNYQQHLENLVEERTAELARRNKELDNFASIAAHDLRAPLRAVSGFAELFAERFQDKVDADSRKYLFHIEQGVERMQLLIDDLLQYARAGRVEKALSEIDINSVLQKVISNLSDEFTASGAVMEKGPLPTIMGDSTQLIQLFQNLIANAVKYRKEAPRIHVSAERKNVEWVFQISDNGIGIDPRQFERIFEPFQRLHPVDQYSGTGMGLAICKKIVERMGGRIWVESKPGEGSTFFFSIPTRGKM